MELVTERLILREFVSSDWPDVLAYQSDSRYLRLNPWTERTLEDAKTFVQVFVAQQREGPRSKFQLAITLKGSHRLIGNCGMRLEPAAMDDGGAHGAYLEADLGYELAPNFWGQGYGTEAARAMLEFGFAELGVHRISAWCIAENAASVRVLEKLGMKAEGYLREKERFKGKWWDTRVFAMLEHEWRARQGA